MNIDADTIWERYENAKSFIDENQIITNTNRNWDFYLGKQWKGLQTGGELPPFYNFIKKNVKYKVGTVCQNRQSAHYLTNNKEEKKVCELLDREYSSLWLRAKMDRKIWDMAKASAIQGDSYMFWGDKEFGECQILPNTCLLLSDETDERIQKQKWIIIRDRRFVSDVRAEAIENGIPEDELDYISVDRDTDYMIGNDKDVAPTSTDGKITSLIYMQRVDGIVCIAKAVQGLIYKPLTPIAPTSYDNGEVATDSGLRLYPIANLVWESIPNSARGQGAVSEMIANQMETNKTLYRRSISSRLSSYPRLAYSADAVQNPDDLDKVGSAIAVQGASSQRVTDMISYLPPQAMSQDAKTLNDDLVNETTSLSGSDDAITGTSDLARVASSTVLAVKDQQALSLNENAAKIKQLYEDIARIWYDQLRAYSPNGIEVNGTQIPRELLVQLEPDIQITVTQDTVWTRDNEQTFWDNMLQTQHITFEEYCHNIPDGGSAPKDKLLDLLQARVQKQIQMAQMMQQRIANGEMDDELMQAQNGVQTAPDTATQTETPQPTNNIPKGNMTHKESKNEMQ